jgi:hypothetical protein
MLGYEYECRARLCQNVDTEVWPASRVTRSDVALLCYARIARAETFFHLDAVTALDHLTWVNQQVAAACEPDRDEACELPLPEGCMQPL